ncbi:MAG TPA: hypothetical protein ENI69_07025, partial [Rhodospirillales bacterium]|nr:hypothetical protein [Rhodospirillales bacterium]
MAADGEHRHGQQNTRIGQGHGLEDHGQGDAADHRQTQIIVKHLPENTFGRAEPAGRQHQQGIGHSGPDGIQGFDLENRAAGPGGDKHTDKANGNGGPAVAS